MVLYSSGVVRALQSTLYSYNTRPEISWLGAGRKKPDLVGSLQPRGAIEKMAGR